MTHENAWNTYGSEDIDSLERLSAEYIDFISAGKTERECTDMIVCMAEKNGYRDLAAVIKNGEKLSEGDRVYAVNMGKAVMLFNIGGDIINRGMNIIGSHIDSPRLDIKQDPLYESDGYAYLNTHYYGGIKKYLYVTTPLALHGVVVKPDGEKISISIGEKDGDPVFFVSDLLIHLSKDQMEKPASKVVDGEALDIMVGTRPLKGEEKDAAKAAVLKLLKDRFGIEEDDFISAEIEAVPAGRAREAGFDRSMILGYGQDDRCCAFPSFKAMMDVKDPKTTSCVIFVDKEEVGSLGASGMESHFFEDMVREVLDRLGTGSELELRRCHRNSRMLSADVNSAYDPLYPDKFEKQNSSLLGRGLVFCKYNGSRGKSGSNDANAEFIASLRRIMDGCGVVYQTAEIGRVDIGGGGTISYIPALYGMEVIDCGIPVLSMHAPHEAISKADLYESYKGYKAFLTEA